jgi:hypothetical protein
VQNPQGMGSLEGLEISLVGDSKGNLRRSH